jgi:hypothetical protein
MSDVSTLKPAISTPYLSVCPDRSPRQKVHTNLGHAKNAVAYRDQWGHGLHAACQIYEWKDNEWSLLYDVPAGTRSNNMPWHDQEKLKAAEVTAKQTRIAALEQRAAALLKEAADLREG